MNSSSTKRKGKGHRFPYKLHAMLDGAEESLYVPIVSWNADGRSFTIHDRDALMQQVAPLYFQQTHFRSFERQLNMWGFKRHGRQGWYHEHFSRNGEELHLIQIKVRTQDPPVATGSYYPSGQVPFKSQGVGDIFGHQQPSQPTSTEAATGKAYGRSGFRPPTASRLTSSRGRRSNATPNIQPDDDKDDTLLLMSKSIHFDDRVPCSCSFCLAYKIASSEDYRPRPPASQKKDLT